MLKIAHNISNLSDARYFAAAGFDWIIFNFGPGAAEHKHLIYGISEWISGSKVGMHVTNVDEVLYHIENHPEVQGFWLEKSFKLELEIDHATLFSELPLKSTSHNYQIAHSLDFNSDASKTILDLTSLEPGSFDLSSLNIAGISLSGTEEERPGFKSYGFMEDWMDILEELND